MSLYEVRIVDMAGTILKTFATGAGADPRMAITVNEVSWELNEPGSASITVPIDHPDADEFLPLVREVQVWRNGAIIHWGVLVQRELGDQFVTWTCPGLLWYFTGRYFGPVSIQYLTNPRFATDLSGWTAVGCTATHSTAVRVRGPGTAKLVSTATGDNYLAQSFTADTGPSGTGGAGLGITVAGAFYLEAMTEPAAEEAGIWVQSDNSIYGTDPQWEPATMNHEVGEIHRVEVSTTLLPGNGLQTVNVRLYSPVGTIYWGATSATSPESLGNAPGVPTDLASVLQQVIAYAQNTTTKSALNIGYDIPNTGVVEHVAYQYSELGNIFDALQTYPARGICDFAMVLTATTRTFTTYAPRKGSHKAGNALTVPGTGVVKLGHRLDGSQTATSVIRRGEGSGSDREFGLATDTSGLNGLFIQDIGDAPPEMPIDGLDSYATTELARLKNVVALPDVVVAAAGWIGAVDVGDTVPVTINWGNAVVDVANKRVVSMTLDCPSDTVSVGFNIP